MRCQGSFVVLCGLLLLGASLSSGAIAGQAPGAKPGSPIPGDGKPGRDRWPVKTASDADAQEIVATPVSTTVEALLALPRPADMPLHTANPLYQSHRARPVETTVYTVDADVMECRLMPDGDYRVVIRGRSGKTMVLEMPNPDPAFVPANSRFAQQIGAARSQFNAKCRPLILMKPLPVHGRARITGIGFFGHTYRPDQVAKDNLIQLHPVLNVKWLSNATAPSGTAKPKKSVHRSRSTAA